MNNSKIFYVDRAEPDTSILKEASLILKKGGVVIFPTETVYGIAALVANQKSCEKLYLIKKRPLDKPLSYHFDSLDSFMKFSRKGVDKRQKMWFNKLIPNPVTLIYFDSRFGKKIGVRITENKVAKIILKNVGGPVFATSVNMAGENAAVRVIDISMSFLKNVDMVIDSGQTDNLKESTVIDISGEKPIVLRQGAFCL